MARRPKPLRLTSRAEWRAWLEDNHASAEEVWLLYYKKHTGKPTIPYDDAVEEALCFGWIDGKLKRIDDEKHMQRYTPRRKRSIWSEHNKRRALKMMRQKLMTEAGLAKVREAKKSGAWQKATMPSRVPRMPRELREALAANEKAEAKFRAFAPSYRTQYIWWVATAKREATRKRRIAEVVKRAAQGKKPGVP